MPTYNLNTTFTNEDLQRFLASGTNVVIAKPTEGGQPNVAWLVFRPLINNNVKWNEEYGIYASNTEIQNGARITQMSSTGIPAVIGKTYTFSPAGSFGPPSGPGTQDAYTVENDYNNLPKGYLTMGLTQDASINGNDLTGNVTSAAAVLFKSTAVMTPFTTVYIWTQSQVVSNTVVTNVTSPMTKVTFGGGISTVSLAYDASTGTFIPAAAKMDAGIGIQHILPRL